ncbi:YcdB/YcdC domain-containing protein [Metabacillus fastidiosus]|uniref:YcdB/YcdC domain-containing protein n=1 Tax=Metabacillus fastidiosus TaxID=1458 RepID=UPI002DBDDCD1|nr:YcdB/YcdC domain-containing protein [Metabacillus fastidiosus]MEC2075358.1 S-layer homology domain-containing protein [Metabacillus fastidiosus]
MKKLQKLGILTLSTGLSIGLLAPEASAASLLNEQQDNTQIRIIQEEEVVTKKDLIKKFKEFFPNQFDFLKDSDFHMDSGHYFPNDDTIRYGLSFGKIIKGKEVYGSVGFVGDKLEIDQFHYQPANAADALFPAKVTEEKAKEIAQTFLKKFPGNNEYKLDNSYSDYYPGTQALTEPIRYSFSFVRTKNEVPISDQQIQISVLGNGEVSNFYRNSSDVASSSYDDITKALPKNEIISKIKENISINLQYRIDYDYQTGDRHVKLVYQPISDVLGVHALSGKWQTLNGLSTEPPKQKEIELISSQPIKPAQTKFSLKEAKAFAEKLLKVDSDKIKLRIESVDETKNHNGQEVISVQYMYEYHNGGSGTSLELDKKTGEIIQYHDMKNDILGEIGTNEEEGNTISSKEALNQAVKYLKQFSPSYLHNYAMPTGEAYFSNETNSFHLSFPRVVNGILVSGNEIFVTISADGSLLGLNINQSKIENWPSIEKAISKDKATDEFFKQLNLELQYVKAEAGEDNNHYSLVYTPVFNKNMYSFLDANTGEWNNDTDKKSDQPVVSHPWAEKELNHLINIGILNIEDLNTFNADAQVTKGAAIEVIVKSLTPFYGYYDENNTSQTFENIDPDHPLYQVIERAVVLGIIEGENTTFDPNERLTKEELAVWYIRTLGLEQAAKNQNIYKLDFADAKDVQAKNTGFVALAHSLGLLPASNNNFNPKQEVTYAQLAVSDVLLAHEAYKKGRYMNYYGF